VCVVCLVFDDDDDDGGNDDDDNGNTVLHLQYIYIHTSPKCRPSETYMYSGFLSVHHHTWWC
jgi:hypothetical protein